MKRKKREKRCKANKERFTCTSKVRIDIKVNYIELIKV